MAAVQIPGATQLCAQLSAMSEQEIKKVLGPDFIVKTQAAIGKARNSGKFTVRNARVDKRKRVQVRGANTSVTRPATANAANRLNRVAKPCNSFLCFCSLLCCDLYWNYPERRIPLHDRTLEE